MNINIDTLKRRRARYERTSWTKAILRHIIQVRTRLKLNIDLNIPRRAKSHRYYIHQITLTLHLIQIEVQWDMKMSPGAQRRVI